MDPPGICFSQTGFESESENVGEFDDTPELEVEKPDYPGISMKVPTIGGSSTNATSAANDVDPPLDIEILQRKRSHDIMMLTGSQGAYRYENGDLRKTPRQQSLLQAATARAKAVDNIFSNPVSKKNPPEESQEETLVKSEFTADKLTSESPAGPQSFRQGLHVSMPGNEQGQKEEGTSSRRSKKWEQRFEDLQAYKKQHGSANPRQTGEHSKDVSLLAKWLSEQRSQFQKGKLARERVEQLLVLGCTGFDEIKAARVPNQTPKAWTKRFEELQAYKRRHGHANPSKSRKSPKAELQLGTWLANQHCKFRKGQLAQEKVDQLLALGTTGFDKSKGRKSWDQWMTELKVYKELHGHANPSQKAHLQLSTWLIRLRFKFRKGLLEEEKVEQLLVLGCTGFDEIKVPNQTPKVSWTKRFEQLQAYKRQYGHANPSKSRECPDLQLGTWLSEQRTRFRKGLLPKEKVEQLLGLGSTGFDESKQTLRNSWDQRMEELKVYKELHGHANPSKKAELQLGGWLISQRTRFRKGLLGQEKVDQLLVLGCTGFDESKQSTQWKWAQRMEELKVYKKLHGHANPSKKADLQLGTWLVHQRSKSCKGLLGQEKVEQLLNLGCTGFDEIKVPKQTPTVSWTKRFEELQAYKSKPD